MKERIEHQIIGMGEPTIVFFNGFRMPYPSWEKVYTKLSGHRLVLFNRFGVGRSAKASNAQDADSVVSWMHEFLDSTHLHKPYLIVAHSLGGLFANLYARRYPDEVLGVVFVESSHPEEIALQKEFKIPSLLNALNNTTKWVEKRFDPFRYSEDEEVARSIEQIEGATAFPAVPIAVVSGTQKMPFVPQEPFEIHAQYQTKLLSLSPDSKQIIASKSGHFPQITEPEVVVGAIKSLLGGN